MTTTCKCGKDITALVHGTDGNGEPVYEMGAHRFEAGSSKKPQPTFCTVCGEYIVAEWVPDQDRYVWGGEGYACLSGQAHDPYVVSDKLRGTGEKVCQCEHHRDRCLFGRMHTWATWYRNGALVRSSGTYHCLDCGSVCTADEEDGLPPCCSAAGHGRMVLREKPSLEAAWCGTWFDCTYPRCTNSVLVPSPELQASGR